ncbi:MAG TPA: ABC transporter permease [Deltaproteobacteria bacterium]|nr:ABC transporter permease [Deltaproteobacteria bacterium]
MLRSAEDGTRRALVSAVLVGFLAGCAAGPDFRRPEPPAASTYLPGAPPSETVAAEGPGGATQRFDTGADIPSEWWSLFRSESLDRRIRLALEENPTLAQARARLAQVREELNARTGATRYPAADAGISAERRKLNLASLGVSTVPEPGPFTLYNASISVSYVLDLFGGNRRALEGLGAKVDYRKFELEAARRTLAANVVNASIRQASLRARIGIARDLLEAQGRQFVITEERYKAGGVSALDVRNQNMLLDQTRALLPPLERELARVTHQLAVYLGREPAAAAVDGLDLDALHLPEEVPVRLPSSLARKRPDIRAAEALWHQASANVGVATADLFPRITLSGSLGSQRTGSGDLLNGVNVWSIAGNLMQPIFRGGALRARKRSAVAAYDEAAAAYRQTVLQGLQEVADALSALDVDARTLQARADAAGHARAGYEIARQQYLLGGISHLALLDARRQLLQSAFDRVQAQADRYADTAALLHALGGGWRDPE